MYRKLAPVVILCAVTYVFGPSIANAAESREEVIQALRDTELQHGSTEELSDKALSEVALLSKTVEAKRDVYARALELYMERIGAGKDVDQALIDYERAEISLAAEWKATRKVLEVIKKQDHLAHEWKHHRTLHFEHHTVEHVLDHHSGRNAVENADHHSYNHSAEHAKGPQANTGSGDVFY